MFERIPFLQNFAMVVMYKKLVIYPVNEAHNTIIHVEHLFIVQYMWVKYSHLLENMMRDPGIIAPCTANTTSLAISECIADVVHEWGI